MCASINLQNFECIKSSFEEIYPIWNEQLWPGRISKIKSLSCLYWKHPRTIIKDKTIFDKYIPTFWALKEGDIIIGTDLWGNVEIPGNLRQDNDSTKR